MMDKNRSRLLHKISKYGFVLTDLHLYLDTHSMCKNALKMYGQYQKRYNELVEEYEDMYGPLTPGLTNTTEAWNWVDGPWPWENQYNIREDR